MVGSLVNTVVNLGSAVLNFDETAKGMAALTTPSGAAMAGINLNFAIQNKIEDYKSGDTYEKAEIIGEGVGEIGQLFFGGTIAGKVGKVANIQRTASAGRKFLGVAAKRGTTVFKSFTKSNFRHNLGQLTGNIAANSQAHHVFPQKFANQFSKAGINIHDPKFGAWWQTSGHLKNASGYNAAWEEFLIPSRSQTEILNFGRQLMGKYGIPVGF